VVINEARLRPGATDVVALRVGYEKLNAETGWRPLVSWEEGILRTIRWYAENGDRWIGRVDWLQPAAVPAS
jgi:nucleoside-diphosphate-sugar epimerase